MSSPRTTEKLILLVLVAMAGTLLGGEALLSPGGKDQDRIISAEERNAPGPQEEDLLSQGPGVEPAQAAPLPKGVAPKADELTPKVERDRVTANAETPIELESAAAPWSGAVRLQGEVRSRGIPIPSQITWRPLDSRGEEEVRVVETDSKGKYAVTLTQPGLHQVEVHPTAFFDEVSTKGIELLVKIPSQAVARWNLTLPGGTLEGSLKSQTGQPVVDAFLELVSVQDSFSCSSFDPSPRRSMSDDEGRFRFEFLAPGDYAVSTAWNPAGGELDEFEADPGARILARSQLATLPRDGHAVIDLQLPGPIPVAGAESKPLPLIRVLEKDEPYLGASVWLRRIDQPMLRGQRIGTTGRDGTLELPNLRGNPGSLLVAQGERSMSIPKPLDVNDTSIELVLQAAGCLHVITRDKDGNGVAASVEVISTAGVGMVWARDNSLTHSASASLETEVKSDLDQHELGPLLPGTYLVRAWTSDGRQASTEATVEVDGKSSPLTLVLGADG